MGMIRPQIRQAYERIHREEQQKALTEQHQPVLMEPPSIPEAGDERPHSPPDKNIPTRGRACESF